MYAQQRLNYFKHVGWRMATLMMALAVTVRWDERKVNIFSMPRAYDRWQKHCGKSLLRNETYGISLTYS